MRAVSWQGTVAPLMFMNSNFQDAAGLRAPSLVAGLPAGGVHPPMRGTTSLLVHAWRREENYLAGSGAAHEGGELAGHGGAADALQQLQARPLAALVLLVLPRHRHKVLQIAVHLPTTACTAVRLHCKSNDCRQAWAHGQPHHDHWASQLKTGPSPRHSYLPCCCPSKQGCAAC